MFLRLLFLLFSLTLLTSNPSFASSDFSINEKIEYLINNAGQATVTHQVDITNNYSQIYPHEYRIQIQGLPLSDLSATDSEGNILTNFSIDENQNSSISLTLNKPKVGKGQINTFKLIYRISNFAQNKGKTWEIALPQMGDNSLENAKITIKTPSDFGSLSFSSIPVKFEDGLTQNTITFQDNSRSKILIILGNYQLFNFKLNYSLRNPSNTTINSEIALIPDTYSQSVYYQSISPPPQGINIDSDGNWIAKYQLKSGEEINIVATGQIKTGLHQSSEISKPENYLSEQSFWPVSNPKIQEVAQTLNNPRSIYNFVVNTLDYNYERINNSGRLGALEALLNPKNSLCTEFTDLFVTLSRAKGIPAREIEGFAYSNNPKIKPVNSQSDVLHAWPEYYDSSKKTWRAIDPTWGKTTNGIDYFSDLDLNHITFVIHGLDSQNPLPPGSYKNNAGEKSVFIEFASDEIKGDQTLPTVSYQKNQLIVQNSTPNSLKNISISSPNLSFNQQIDYILPYSSASISSPKISFLKSLLPKNKKLNILITDEDGKTSSQVINYPPHLINLGITIVLSLIILTTSGIIITKQIHEKNS
ncbi:MAG TPA: transglutaminase domain-containing protein [Candidatus Methanoperedens sp.]|nr:transglutaminase domain-containing protein [Candidatus Methanoperedens sp.]